MTRKSIKAVEEIETGKDLLNRKVWRKTKVKHNRRTVICGVLTIVLILFVTGILVYLMNIMAFTSLRGQSSKIGEITAKAIALVILEIQITKQAAEFRQKLRYKKYPSFAIKRIAIISLNTIVAIAIISWIFIPFEMAAPLDKLSDKARVYITVLIIMQMFLFVFVANVKKEYLKWLAD